MEKEHFINLTQVVITKARGSKIIKSMVLKFFPMETSTRVITRTINFMVLEFYITKKSGTDMKVISRREIDMDKVRSFTRQ